MFELIIDAKTARALGIEISLSLLARAEESGFLLPPFAGWRSEIGRNHMKATILVTLLAAVAVIAPASANQQVEQLTTDHKQWVLQTRDYANTRYSELNQIHTKNVGDLEVAWRFSTGVQRGHEGGPLVVGDVMYVHTPFPNIVYALYLDPALTPAQRIKWKYEPTQEPNVPSYDPQAQAATLKPPQMCCDVVNRGLAYAKGDGVLSDGVVFLHQADTTLVALNADTGKEVWKVVNGDPERGESNTATVLPVKDKVIVGISGGEYGARCHVTAYDMSTGTFAWRAYSTGPDDEMRIDPVRTTALGKPVGKNSSLRSWQGQQWQLGGGCTWGWYSYDPQLNLFYYGTGNPGTWNPNQRPRDNKWSTSIFARNPENGWAKWVYQMTPHDEWDYDGVNEMILVDREIEGRPRKLLVHFDRNGFVYTLDRDTGELIEAKKVKKQDEDEKNVVNWASRIDMDRNNRTYGRPLVDPKFSPEHNGEDRNTRSICPAALGLKDQQPAAYSPETELFYVPTNRVCMDYEPFKVEYTAGQPYVGARVIMYPAPGSQGDTGRFIAWDPREGSIVGSYNEVFSVWSGALATAGDVVFYGTLEGYLKAVHARPEPGQKLKLLYNHETGSGIIGNPMTYMYQGKQYVAVLSGVGGWPGIGLVAGLTDPHDGLGAVGAYASLSKYTEPGGELIVFALPGPPPD